MEKERVFEHHVFRQCHYHRIIAQRGRQPGSVSFDDDPRAEGDLALLDPAVMVDELARHGVQVICQMDFRIEFAPECGKHHKYILHKQNPLFPMNQNR